MELIVLTVVLICTAYFYFKHTFSYWTRKGVVQCDPSIPFGNTKQVILQQTTIGENILRLYKKLKSPGRRYAGIYFFTKPDLLLLDPELVKTIMSKEFQYFSDRGLPYDEKNDPLTAHLLTLNGAEWKIMRQKLTPTFSSGKLKMMFQTVLDCSDGLEDILANLVNNSEPVDIKEISGRFTTDIIGSCAFGLDCNSIKDPDTEFRKYGKMVFEPTRLLWFKRLLNIVFPRLYNMLGLTKTDKDVNDFFINIVQDTVDYREKNNIKRNDFLQLLINVRNSTEGTKNISLEEKDKNLTINQIAAQSFLFFLAGFETSSTTTAFFFYDLALHQDIQDKVRKEINDMLQKYNGKLTYEGIMELQYLDKVINESMRLHASIPVLQRRCTKNFQIPDSDVVIEKDTTVFIPVVGFQSDPEFFPKPEKFDPERFSAEEKEKRHPFTFLPFGEGPRNCIGLRFGMVQTKVGIIVLLKNHRFTLSDKTKVPFKMEPKNIIFSVQGGIWLNAEKI